MSACTLFCYFSIIIKQYLQYKFPFFFVVMNVRHLIYQKHLYMNVSVIVGW